MNILSFIPLGILFSQPSFGMNFHELSRRSGKNDIDAKWMFMKQLQPNMNSIGPKPQHDRKNQILAAFELNHQECDMVLQKGRRRRVKCHDGIPNHGRAENLFSPFMTATKIFSRFKIDHDHRP